MALSEEQLIKINGQEAVDAWREQRERVGKRGVLEAGARRLLLEESKSPEGVVTSEQSQAISDAVRIASVAELTEIIAGDNPQGPEHGTVSHDNTGLDDKRAA